MLYVGCTAFFQAQLISWSSCSNFLALHRHALGPEEGTPGIFCGLIAAAITHILCLKLIAGRFLHDKVEIARAAAAITQTGIAAAEGRLPAAPVLWLLGNTVDAVVRVISSFVVVGKSFGKPVAIPTTGAAVLASVLRVLWSIELA